MIVALLALIAGSGLQQTVSLRDIVGSGYATPSSEAKSKQEGVVKRAQRAKQERKASTSARAASQLSAVKTQVAAAPKAAQQPATLDYTFHVVDERDRPMADFKGLTYRAFTTNPQGDVVPLATEKPALVDSAGRFSVRGVRSSPAFIEIDLDPKLAPADEWQLEDAGVKRVPIRSGLAKARANETNRPMDGGKLRLERQVVDLVVTGVPAQATVRLGDASAPARYADGKAHFRLDRELVDDKEFDLIVETPGPIRRAATVPVGGRLSPYRDNVVGIPADAWRLEAIDSISVGGQQLAARISSGDDAYRFDNLLLASRILRAVGEPPRTVEETVKSGTTQVPTGAEWLEYPGFRTKVRTIRDDDGHVAKVVESTVLTGAEGGDFGGIRVGSPAGDVLQALGPGRLLGSRREYFGGGVVFGFDATESKVQEIEFVRPPAFLASALEERPFARPLTLHIAGYHADLSEGMGSRNEVSRSAIDQIFDSIGTKLETALAQCDWLLSKKLQAVGGFEVSGRNDADLILEWIGDFRGEDRGKGAARLRVRLNVLSRIVQGRHVDTPHAFDLGIIERTGEGEDRLFGVGESPGAMAVRRAREKLALDVIERLRGMLGFELRVTDVDRTTGVVEIAITNKSFVKPGDEFTLVNLTAPAMAPLKASCRFEGDRRDSDREVFPVVRIVSIRGDRAVGQISGVAWKGQPNQGNFEAPVVLKPETIRDLAKGVLDPGTGVVMARYRLKNAEAKD